MPQTVTDTRTWLRPPSSTHRGWKRQIVGIKAQLCDKDDFETVQRVAGRIAAILKCQPEFEEGGFDDFSTLVDEIEGISTASTDDYDKSLSVCQHFNYGLDALYDWADAERIIIA